MGGGSLAALSCFPGPDLTCINGSGFGRGATCRHGLSGRSRPLDCRSTGISVAPPDLPIMGGSKLTTRTGERHARPSSGTTPEHPAVALSSVSVIGNVLRLRTVKVD